MTGGIMDEYVEALHAMVGVSDGEQEGAYREYSDRNKFGFYIARNGELLVANDSGVFGDTFLGKRVILALVQSGMSGKVVGSCQPLH